MINLTRLVQCGILKRTIAKVLMKDKSAELMLRWESDMSKMNNNGVHLLWIVSICVTNILRKVSWLNRGMFSKYYCVKEKLKDENIVIQKLTINYVVLISLPSYSKRMTKYPRWPVVTAFMLMLSQLRLWWLSCWQK